MDWLTLFVVSVLCVFLVLMGSGEARAANELPAGIPSELHKMPSEPLQTRWFTFENIKGEKGVAAQARFGRKGSPCTVIPKKESFVVADIEGSGTIRRIWFTTHPRTPDVLRSVKLEMFWDGAKTPAVQCPVGDFFCHSLGQMVRFENACFSSPEGRSYNCIVTMPFRKGAKIVLKNETDENLVLYYDVACTLGDNHGDDTLYFHSYWRRMNMTAQRDDMNILPLVKGKGRFLGCNLGNRLHPLFRNFWMGEGEIKVYLDGDKEFPTLCGTGTEDFIGSGWGQEHFVNLYQGNQYFSKEKGAYGFYRFHIPDPIYFYNDIKVDIQNIAGGSYQAILDAMNADPSIKVMKVGKGGEYYTREELEANKGRVEIFETMSDYSATAYWYMDKPENGLPPIQGREERVKDLP